MKKWIALVLVFLLSAMSVAAAAEEIDFSSYTEAELRELRTQIDSEILSHCSENAQSVCDAFIQYMQELGHTLDMTLNMIRMAGSSICWMGIKRLPFFYLAVIWLDCKKSS